MKLRFVGEDGSLGLRHGDIYEVKITQFGNLLCVRIKTGWISETICPYETTMAFAKNWALVR